MEITRFILERRSEENPDGKGRIDISPRQESDHLISGFTSFRLDSPYATTQGVDGEKFYKLLEPLMALQIRDFVEDNPVSLAPYGLDRPGRLYIESLGQTLEILFGKSENGLRYAMIPGENSVFTIDGFEALASPSSFDLMDKFALIYNIDNVDSFTVSADGRILEATIQGTYEDAIFHLNGRKAADKEFRVFYQKVIGLLIDGDFSGTPARGEGTDLVVEYRMNTPAGLNPSIRLIPYNRDFYILEKEGVREFVIARTQAREIFDAADSMVYID
jgi:hypothetical protein